MTLAASPLRPAPYNPADPVQDEAEWLARAMDRLTLGDHQTFQDVYRRTSARLFGICLRILTEPAEAEHALGEAYVIIWRRAASFDETRGAAMTWMTTIARDRAIDRLRRAGGVSTAPIGILDQAANTDPRTIGILEPHAADGFQVIDPFDALLIRTALLEGSTYAELARRTGMPVVTLRNRLRRALPRLRHGSF